MATKTPPSTKLTGESYRIFSQEKDKKMMQSYSMDDKKNYLDGSNLFALYALSHRNPKSVIASAANDLREMFESTGSILRKTADDSNRAIRSETQGNWTKKKKKRSITGDLDNFVKRSFEDIRRGISF